MKKKALKAAFPYTIPIGIGFLFLGMSYGFMMQSKGFSVCYPFFMSMFIFAGSMEFVTANLLLSAFSPIAAFFLALVVNARHLFYGLSMLDKYKNTGWKKFYLIFGMCDESFTVNCSDRIDLLCSLPSAFWKQQVYCSCHDPYHPVFYSRT